jgi:2-C-methyl-D-erythritol 2,4-cyclodiphosphate synthase
MMVRVGLGYDVHAFSDDVGRVLMLGGVPFNGARALAGHSDADVVLHAVCDALLGACALGDIGDHFPPGDPSWKDADSLELLRRVRTMLPAGCHVANVDCTVIAEEPKIGSRKLEMRRAIADALAISVEHVSVKATTNEGLGAIGRGEGIAAFAAVLVEEAG